MRRVRPAGPGNSETALSMPATVLRIFQDFVSSNRVSRPIRPFLKMRCSTMLSASLPSVEAYDAFRQARLPSGASAGQPVDFRIENFQRDALGGFAASGLAQRAIPIVRTCPGPSGLIAEVVNVFPELVTRGSDGAVESVQYHELVPMLLNELQRQRMNWES
jgi:hypothetical protein